MKMLNIDKEKIKQSLKTVFGYALIVVALVGGFFIGRYTQNYPPKPEVNAYATALKPEDISIAVNESNELMIIERKTGKYIVYSDAVGLTIFKMYTNRIYQKASNDE